jgi:hypothetical protein
MIFARSLFVSLHSTQKYFLTSCNNQQEERYLRENRHAIVIYESILYFNNLSTHPKNTLELRYIARSSVNSGDKVGRIADVIHMNLSLVVVWRRNT